MAKAKQQNEEERKRRNLSVKKSREKKKRLLLLVASSVSKSDDCDIGCSDHIDYNGDQDAHYDIMENTPVDDEANFAFDTDTHASDPEDVEANFALAADSDKMLSILASVAIRRLSYIEVDDWFQGNKSS